MISKKTISRKKIDHHIIYSLGLDYASCLNSRALLFTDMHGPIRSSLSRNVSWHLFWFCRQSKCLPMEWKEFWGYLCLLVGKIMWNLQRKVSTRSLQNCTRNWHETFCLENGFSTIKNWPKMNIIHIWKLLFCVKSIYVNWKWL